MFMKSIFTIFLVLFFSFSFAQNTVHFRIHSHNEIQDINEGIDYTNSAHYGLIKSALVQIKDTFEKYQAKWNLQAESNFIRGCLINDLAHTNSVDLLQAFDSHTLIEVDPHNHLSLEPGLNNNPFNYADVAHLLDSCGLTPPRTNVGGFLYKSSDWSNPTSDDWTTYKNGLVGNTYTSYTWTPTTLWGGGTPGHTNDYNAFGVWRPSGASTLAFGQNNASNLINIGNGCKKWFIEDTTNVTAKFNDVNAYISNCYSAPTNSLTFYTASVTMNLRGFLSNATGTMQVYPPMIDSVAKFIRKMDVLKTSGKIVYENLSETKTNWTNLHSSPTESFVVQCANIALGVEEDALTDAGFGFYPNPVTNELVVYKNDEEVRISIYTVGGQLIREEQIKTNSQEVKLNVADLTEGVYILKLGNGYRKFVKQ